MSVHLSPEEIEAQSFRIIDAEVGAHPWSPAEWPVVRRAIHTSADFEYARSLFFSPDVVEKAVEALRRGRGIVTDTTMALSGIGKERLARFGIGVSCFVADPEVAREAKAQGVTRSILAMRKGAADPANGIFVIGNAPTALFELLRLVREEMRRIGAAGLVDVRDPRMLEPREHVWLVTPAIIRRVVVLPEPDGPSSVMNSPSRTSRLTPSTADTSPNFLTRSRMTSARASEDPFPAVIGPGPGKPKIATSPARLSHRTAFAPSRVSSSPSSAQARSASSGWTAWA